MPTCHPSKRAYLITLEHMGNVTEYERRLIDHEAWMFLDEGGDPPEKLFRDTSAGNPEDKTPYNTLTLNDADEDADDDVLFRMRCFAVQNSSFGGEFPDTTDINELIAFVTRHKLVIIDEYAADNNY